MVSSKHDKILDAIFANPVRANIRWLDIEKMIEARGGKIEERSGSRVRVTLNGRRAVFHRPHPKPETDKGALVALRLFLREAGLTS